MRNVLGVLIAALGAGLALGAHSIEAALTVAGILLLSGALVLVIDWDE